jgi:hypothetical protein
MCLDIESSYHNHRPGIRAPASHRAEILAARPRPRFHGGVVYDEESDTHHEFLHEQIEEMVRLLAIADQLISQNGKRHDLPILEAATDGFAAILRPLPHWDLLDMGSWKSLDKLSETYVLASLPEIRAAFDARREKNETEHPGQPWGKGFLRPPTYWQEDWLAKAEYDVRRTYAVWKVMVPLFPNLKPASSDGD